MVAPARAPALERDAAQNPAERVREADVRDQAAAEERADAPARPIDELIGNHDVERLVSSLRLPTALADRMYSTPSIFIPKMLARKFSSDGEQAVPGAVPRQERHASAAQRAERRTGPTDRQTAS